MVKNALASTADEMALVIMRSAYSPVVRDTMDYSTALCDRNGRVVAQGLTLAVQLGTFPTVMGYVLEELGPTAQPGDVYIANDPYGCGGQHLPDIYVIKPVFVDGALEGYAATMAHHSDVGGIAPGSIAVHATEIYQEGLRIPLSKLVDAGVENTMLLRLIEANTRQPVHVLGDLRAQLAACRVGERGLTALIERYGSDAHDYMDELQRVAERMMRAELAKLPDGVHAFTDYIDGVGDEPVPIPICVRVEIAGDEVLIDLEGTSPQVEASVNCPVGMVYAAAYCAIRGIVGGEIPNCEGYMVPIRINAPAGTVVNPVLPAACGARGVIGYRVYDAIMGALAPIVPDRVIAAGEGGPTLIAWGGYEQQDDRAQAVRHHRGARRQLGRALDPRRARGRLEPARQPRQPAGRADRGRPAAADRALRRRARLGRRGAPAWRARLRARVRVAGRQGDADDPHRSPRPSSLRPRRRRARRAVEQRRRLRRRGARAADDADARLHARAGRPVHPRLGRRRRLRRSVRARSRGRARGRARRQGVRRGRSRPLRRRGRSTVAVDVEATRELRATR